MEEITTQDPQLNRIVESEVKNHSQGIPKKSKNRWAFAIIGLIVLVSIIGFGWVYVKGKAASPTKVYRVGVLIGLDFFSPTFDGFKAEMTKLGYVEGKNIVYDVQRPKNIIGNQELIKKFVNDKVDLIFVFPTEPSIEAKEATEGTGIPVISSEAFVEEGKLVDTIQKPGGNLTGVRFPIVEIAAKRLEILHQLAPDAKRILVPYLKGYPTVEPSLKIVRPLAQSLGLTIIEAPFASTEEVEGYLDSLSKKKEIGIDAILEIPEPLTIMPGYTEKFYAFADRNKLPVAGATVIEADYGPAFSLIPDSYEFGLLAAPIADKIFSGIPTGTIPMVTPESVFQINMRVLEKLGLVAGEGLMSTAKKIIR